MPRIALQGVSRAASDSTASLYSQFRNVLTDLESQLNSQPNVYSRSDKRIPKGIRTNDLVITLYKGVLTLGVYDGKKVRSLNASDLQVLQKHNTNFVGHRTGTTVWNTAATRSANIPNSGDWGFYENTAGPTFHLIFNLNGTTQGVAL